MTLAGQLAVVTGGSRGIGLATASVLRDAGARVVRVARSLATGEHDGFYDLGCDLTDAPSWHRNLDGLLRNLGVPRIVVSNAGAFLLKPLAETSEAEFDRQVAVNLRGAFSVARGLLPPMRAAGRGVFIHIGSIADHIGFPENSAYSASKYGLRGLHESLVAEYAGSGVRLSLLSPGPTDTSVWDAVDRNARPDLPDRARMLRPEDIAAAVLWLVDRPAHVHVDWLRLGPA